MGRIQIGICPLCREGADISKEFGGDTLQGHCDRCGRIHITEQAVGTATALGKLIFLSWWFRRIPNRDDVTVVKALDVARIISEIPEYSVLQKLEMTLDRIALQTKPGQRSTFNPQKDYPLVYAESADETIYYVTQLRNLGYVDQDSTLPSMTANGYRQVEKQKKTGSTSSFAFVAMWFDSSMNEIYNAAIVPAIENAGYKPIRIDRTEHVNRIDDEIISKIKQSRFMIADFTGQRQGVYFEAGMMLGLGRTVIWMCHEDELKDTHFDARQYNFINYSGVAEARKRLYDRITAIEGVGPAEKKTA